MIASEIAPAVAASAESAIATPDRSAPAPDAQLLTADEAPPPGHLWIGVPDAMTVPLIRNLANPTSFLILVDSEGPWSLYVRDPRSDGTGHMTDEASGRALEKPLDVVKGDTAASLDGVGVDLATGAGDASVIVTVTQVVGPGDPPGEYSIALLFTAVAAF